MNWKQFSKRHRPIRFEDGRAVGCNGFEVVVVHPGEYADNCIWQLKDCTTYIRITTGYKPGAHHMVTRRPWKSLFDVAVVEMGCRGELRRGWVKDRTRLSHNGKTLLEFRKYPGVDADAAVMANAWPMFELLRKFEKDGLEDSDHRDISEILDEVRRVMAEDVFHDYST